jgi:hypothetical protein
MLTPEDLGGEEQPAPQEEFLRRIRQLAEHHIVL